MWGDQQLVYMSSMQHYVGCVWECAVFIWILCGKSFHVVHGDHRGAVIMLWNPALESVIDEHIYNILNNREKRKKNGGVYFVHWHRCNIRQETAKIKPLLALKIRSLPPESNLLAYMGEEECEILYLFLVCLPAYKRMAKPDKVLQRQIAMVCQDRSQDFLNQNRNY